MSNSWDTIPFCMQNSMNTFTAQQVQHVFSFVTVRVFPPTLDFENVQEMDDSVFEYWIGLTKEKFNTLFQEVSRLGQIKRGSVDLAALLLKMRTGDSNERISTLVKVPRRTLESLMDKVREVLLQNFVPVHLGINQLGREQLLQHNLLIPNGLYGNGNNAIVICDGTYKFIYTRVRTICSKSKVIPYISTVTY